MSISRTQAVLIGIVSILVILALQAMTSFGCYKDNFHGFVSTIRTFVLIPLLPAIISLAFPNALRAVGACALLAPWLLLAYYTDCIKPYTGGGASMSYVGVLLWGTPSAVVGALITGPITRRLGIEIK